LKIVALSLFGAFLGIFSNVLRVNSIVLIDWVRDSQMDLGAHGAIQWIALFATLGFLFYVLSRLKIEATSVVPVASVPVQAGSGRKFAPMVAGLAVLLVAGGTAGFPKNEARPPHEPKTDVFPSDISGWKRIDPAPAWSVELKSGTESISMNYRSDGRDLQVVIVETLSPTAKLPESRLAPHDENIWHEKQVRNEAACVASHCMGFVHSTWQRDKSPQLRHVYYAYTIGSFITDSKFALRAAHGWDRLMGGRENPRLIGFVLEDTAGNIDELAAAFQTFQSAVDDANRG